jgi:hypothetical protein
MPRGDVGVERGGIGDVSSHRNVTNGKDGEDGRNNKIGKWHADQIGDGKSIRYYAGDRGERADRRHHEKHDGDHT